MASILVVAAHPDDEVLGCGGTIARHAAAGDDVHVLIVGEGITARATGTGAGPELLRDAAGTAGTLLGTRSLTLGEYPDQRLDSVERLELTQLIEGHVAKYSPAIVYTHHWADVNTDHTLLGDCVTAACRPTPQSAVATLLFFEVPSSTEWGSRNGSFNPNWFVDITKFLDVKLAALRAYGAELRDFPHPRSEAAVTHLARWRGASAGVEAAEAFVLGRNVEP